jgi:hypothetical protein
MPTRRNNKTLKTTHKTQPLAAKATELAFAVPQVVAHRLTRMAMAGPFLSERDRKEFELMGSEKSSAFHESWNAMAEQSVRAHQALTVSFLRSFLLPSLRGKPTPASMATELHNAALDVLGKGMAPVHRRAVANARRLARTKLR